ncbi:MAG: DUF6412 domain-containing protein [Pseudonocardiaceae bacterium]
MYRAITALLSTVAVLFLAPVDGGNGNIAAVGAGLAVLLITVVITAGRDPLVPETALVSRVAQRQAHEQGRRGAFQRQSRPDTQGRPRPRAPGLTVRPA